ncbi:MAG: hypothetical protein KBC56_07280 [Flavobacterium sp.]|nr:hypothetical protein [Flavobacterium sp.]
MKNLSGDLEIAIDDAINVLQMEVDVDGVDSDKLAKLLQSKTEGFLYTKELILDWQGSQNSPSQVKLRKYIEKLIKSGHNSIETLRQALRKKITEVDPEKIGLSIKSKPILFKGINSINTSIIELQNQLDADNIDLKAREFSVGFPEKFANQELYPKKNYHKEWLDEKTGAIMIDPLGSKGEVIVLDNLKIMLPALPRNKKDVLFSNLPKEEQYWRRQEVPSGLTPETQEVYTEYILKEFKRRREGVWFMNNGVPTWLTPAHYLGLQWNEMLETGGFKEFRLAQATMYYFALACICDPRSVGMIFCKGRRTGFTEMVLDHIVDKSTSTKNAKFGITSKTEKDAISAFLKYSYVVQNLPFFFIPVVKGKIDDINKMVFGKPSDNSKAAKKIKDTSTKDYLNTIVDYRATATLAYDSIGMDMYLGDEAGKWERPNNYVDHWNNLKPTLVQGARVKGKALIGSTLNPYLKGGKEFQEMYYGSDVTQRNHNDNTPTGLYSFFLPAHKNYERFTDVYGVCHEVLQPGESFINSQNIKQTIGSLQYLENEFKSAKSMGGKAYNNTRRLDPVTIDDAFRDELATQLFDVEKINAQLKFNRDVRIEETLVRGNFYWKDNIKDTIVEWKPQPQGRFLISWFPPKEMQNKWITKPIFGVMTKCPAFEYAACGADSYDQTAVIDAKLVSTENGTEWSLGSKGAIHGLTGLNMGDIPSNYFFLEYIARPKSAETFFEDCLMATIFYSIPILIENNKKMLLKHYKTRGYRGYSITRFDKLINRLSPDEKELGGYPSSGEDSKIRHWSGLESYINKYIGEYYKEDDVNAIREEGEMGSMPFQRTLQDWLKFNPEKRTAFDASMSSGLAIMGINRNMYAVKSEAPKASFGFRMYQN